MADVATVEQRLQMPWGIGRWSWADRIEELLTTLLETQGVPRRNLPWSNQP